MQGEVIAQIVTRSLANLRRVQQALYLHHSLQPYQPNGLFADLQDRIPAHCKLFEDLLLAYRIPPPISPCGLHKPVLIGLLTHFSPQQAEATLAVLLSKCGQQLNDDIRELNSYDLDEKPLRTALISSRNDLDGLAAAIPPKTHPWMKQAAEWLL